MLKHIYILTVLLLALAACITEYEHPGIDNLSGLLVVEGTITNDSTFVTLSRSVGLSDHISDSQYIDDAYVTVESESGGEFYGDWKGTGRYYVLTGDLDTRTRYRLKIELEGHTYVSEYLEPIVTPDIDNLELYKEAAGEDVQLRVSAKNTEDGSRYYRWSYEEIWEYNATFAATHYQEPFLNGPEETHHDIFEYDPYSPYNFCWGYDSSNSLLLASTVKLTVNNIDNYTLAKFPPTSNRFTMLYWVKVKQNSLRKEAYEYFSKLKENAENTGSIFGPVPSEMKGNITCITDESIPVIGYMEVATTAVFEEFISLFNGIYETAVVDCPGIADSRVAAQLGVDWEILTIVNDNGEAGKIYSFPSCIDCRRGGGYNDRKPSFWPNDHI